MSTALYQRICQESDVTAADLMFAIVLHCKQK